MADKTTIEKLVEAIKGYFSIIGLLLVGIYLIKNPAESFLHIPLFNYIGGASAILVGSITGLWYSIHLLRTVLPPDERANLRHPRVILLWVLVVLSSLLILTEVMGAISMSCGQLLN